MGEWPPDWFDVARPMVDVDQDGVLEDLTNQSRTWIATLTHPVLFTTPTDLVKWMKALYYDQTILSSVSLNAMLTYPNLSEMDPEGGRYGLGVVDFTDILGVKTFGHAGSSLGYSAAALCLPCHRVLLAWATNTGENPTELANRIMRNTWQYLSSVLFQQLNLN
jgi:hypothetical protein